jgi:hypothetical protein
VGRGVAKEVLAARIQAGVCRNSPKHGPATRGLLCASCAERARLRSARTRGHELPADVMATAFWEALQDLFDQGRLF